MRQLTKIHRNKNSPATKKPLSYEGNNLQVSVKKMEMITSVYVRVVTGLTLLPVSISTSVPRNRVEMENVLTLLDPTRKFSLFIIVLIETDLRYELFQEKII